ncbi:MAG: nickel pincer cofactor biosynthesis protein LarC, partial [Acidimicrobiia bacterium]|nr:nickel pincer cofactor biosynthesis protein LarC [Acidimicrobiia bacterium]
MTTLWLDPGFGASGDMVLGVLLGLGAPVERVRADLDELAIDGWHLDWEPTERAGIAAIKATVTTDDTVDHPHRAWSAIDALLTSSDLAPEVVAGARATFRRLGEVEATIHRVELDEVHFHEVGAIDAIVDIVGAWSALRHLAVDEVMAGPVGLGGGGTVATAHGQLPVPAPATLALLHDVPVRGIGSPAETVTPTGAALLTTMVTSWGPIPPGRLGATARGAGGRDPETHPNVLTGLLLDSSAEGTVADETIVGARTVPAVVLATNLDDVTPEVLGYVVDRLLTAGADDAWLVPIGMKKSRPGHELRVLCRPDLVTALAEIVFAETGTLGLRAEPVTKHVAPRRFETVEVRGCVVRIKVGPLGAKPEHDDLTR